MKKRFLTAALTMAVLASMASCTVFRGTAKLEPYECGSVKRLHTYDGIFLASQPAPDDFREARDGGIKTVVDLRKPGELDWDEAALVSELGLEYHRIPFKSPAELTDGVFDRARALLGDAERRPLLLHCASANRVGAIWLTYRVLDGGLSFDQAVLEARTVGLKLPAYEERAREYIQTKRAG